MLDSYKSQMLGLYYLATLPHRKHLAQERRATGTVPIISLLYHRVADENPNSWTIDWDRFRYQIEWLSQQFEIVSLPEAQQRIAAGYNAKPVVCITFDDGYADNCDKAIPWLIERKIPVTYFVTTDNILTGRPFPHDLQRKCPLAPNTVEQIQAMADAGIEIGAHTRSHPDLGRISSTTELTDEIVGSKYDLESLLDAPVRYFAFPYGLHENMTSAGFRIAYEAGYAGVCSAYGAYNLPGDDSFHIQRIHGDPQWTRFVNWMTVDPRKLRNHAPFDPGNYRGQPEVVTH
jgi:peptidoglycan/xylan/chitin deacetylase (PgdA/CDA1 family)